jgi:hypothetical protein
MNSAKKTARAAGLLYLLVAITGFFSTMYVPSACIVPGDPAATANKIRISESLFRIGIVSELISASSFIFLAMALYDLLKGVNKRHAALMVILAVVSVPIAFLNELNPSAALVLLSGSDFLSVFDPRQLDALVMVFLRLHSYGFFVGMIFWGLWLFPFGVLVYRSGFLPRILGILLVVACFAYLTGSLTALLLPNYGDAVNRFALIPEGVGELSIMAWLLIKGAEDQPLDART